MRRASAACERLLCHPRLPLWLALLAAVLTLPSLGAGLLVDDYHHKLLMQGSTSPLGPLHSPLDLFRFFDGDLHHNTELRNYGITPWWTDLNLKGAFWRPFASATHWLDYRLWPNSPALMHAQSIAWYALLVSVVAVLYRRILGIGVAAGLAALLYAVDSTHATPVAFLANRNALTAGVFCVLCMIAHARWRRENWRPGALVGPLLLLAGLLAKEEAIAICAYLAAFAVFLDDAPWRTRLGSLLPYAAVVIVWRIVWLQLGYGVSHLGLYVDPLQEPARFAVALVTGAPILLLSQLSIVPAEIVAAVGEASRSWLWIPVGFILLAMAAIALPALRSGRIARFWLVGMLLSLLPAVATVPQDRMLLFPGLGAMALISELLIVVFSRGLKTRGLRRITAVGLVWVLAILHLAVAPVALAARTAAPMGPRSFLESLYMHRPLDPAVEKQDLIIVNPPIAFTTLPSLLIWAAEQQPLPKHLRSLCSNNFQPVEVERADERTLIVRPYTGFVVNVMDRMFIPDGRRFSVGERLHVTGMDIEITGVFPNGPITEAAFRFDAPLDDPAYRWLQWRAGEFVPFTPPPVGQKVVLDASFRDLLPARWRK